MRRFAYRLALALGEADIDALLARLPRRALLEWIAYHELEPWDQDRADARAGIIASTVFNAFRGRGQRRARPYDFFAYRPPRQPMSAAKKALFRQMMLKAGARSVDADAD